MLLDLSVLQRQADFWFRFLPRVDPYYAVKCNPHAAVLETLWSIWRERGRGGYDCASKREVEVVMELPNLDPSEHIVFSHPCKRDSDISFAQAAHVTRLVFDNASELHKIQRIYPGAELLLRIVTDDCESQCPLSNKYGAFLSSCHGLLCLVKQLCLNFVGVCFHVGSACSKHGVFRAALVHAKGVFTMAEGLGFTPTLVDIGGGFVSMAANGHASFVEHAAEISTVLDELFPSRAISVIAEPGRFYVAEAQALLVKVVSTRLDEDGPRYYLNDGVYGSFNCLVFDHAQVTRPQLFRGGRALGEEEAGPQTPCTVFGATCDGFDTISVGMSLPRLEVGDHLLYGNMGAYTNAASTSFNGFSPASFFVYRSALSSAKESG